MTSERAMVEALMSYVDTATGRWTDLEPGYRRQTLVNDRGSGTRIVLLQYDAGYELSYLDEHQHDEYLYILAGTFVDQNQSSGPGTFIHNRPGSAHRPSSPDGCTFLAVVTASPRATADVAAPLAAPVEPAPPGR